MALIKYLIVALIVLINISEIMGHGYLYDPVNRGSAYKKKFPTPKNYDDDGNNCGGDSAHFIKNKGKCGLCGDDYAHKQPRANENGGKYGKGVIVKKYEAGSIITAEVKLTTNHRGFFNFTLCPLKNKTDLETEECFKPIELVSGGFKFPVKTDDETFKVDLRLPKNLKCKQCVLRWEYIVGNSWGQCADGTEGMGCGNQETFRTCSDIEIH